VQRVLVECVLNFVDHRFLNEKILWILVIHKNHEIKSTTDFLCIRYILEQKGIGNGPDPFRVGAYNL